MPNSTPSEKESNPPDSAPTPTCKTSVWQGDTYEALRYCPKCKKNVNSWRPKPAHLLHLILSIITLGGWFIYWVLMSASNRAGGWHCYICGSRTGQAHSTPAPASDSEASPSVP